MKTTYIRNVEMVRIENPPCVQISARNLHELSAREFNRFCDDLARIGGLKRLTISHSKFSQARLDQLARALPNSTLDALRVESCDGAGLTWNTVVDALPACGPQLREVAFMNTKLGDDAACRLGDALPRTAIRSLDVLGGAMGEAGLVGLCAGIAHSRTLEKIITENNPEFSAQDGALTDAGYEAVLDAIAKNHSLTSWKLRKKPDAVDATHAVRFHDAEAAFLAGHGGAGLVDFKIFTPSHFEQQLLARNITRANTLLMGMAMRTPEQTPLADRFKIERYLPVMERCATASHRSALKSYQEFLDVSIPKNIPSALPTIDALFEENTYGLTLLDNVKTWEMFPNLIGDLLDADADGVLEILTTRKTTYGHSLLDYGLAFGDAHALVKSLNGRGIQLQAAALLDPVTKQANDTLDVAMSSDRIGALFRKENWEGASSRDLNAVVNALTPQAKKQIPNLHQLQLYIVRQEKTEKMR